MLVEVLTYLDWGLRLTGCPVDGMDKHKGGMFEIPGSVSKEQAAERLIMLCSLCHSSGFADNQQRYKKHKQCTPISCKNSPSLCPRKRIR